MTAARVRSWLFAPAPLRRLALLRLAVFGFVVLDVLGLHTSGWYHGYADPAWYQPLALGRLLGIPAASPWGVELLKWGSVLCALAACSGRRPRTLGWATAVCWTGYQYVAFSYGKVDHDRADFLVALFLLPTVGIAHLSDRRRSEAAGFALRCVQLMAVATYFLSAVAKVRFGGWDWVDSATIVRAVLRGGTPLSHWMLQVPWTLHAFQYVLFTAELTSPVLFLVSERRRRHLVGAWYLFHAATYGAIMIAFWPHLVMMLAFLPLEAYADRLAARWAPRRSSRWGPEPRGRPPVAPPLALPDAAERAPAG